jgi:hypothetical protein
VHTLGLFVELGQVASGVRAHKSPSDLPHVIQMSAVKTWVPVFERR